jgi:CelD/BcsL family acetyltransferase involved in cellulose biosynthesis
MSGGGRAVAEVRVLTTLAELGEVAAEWDDLRARAGAGNPFLAHGWLASYWRAFGDRDGLLADRRDDHETGLLADRRDDQETGLRVVCVRAGGRLIAGAALRTDRRPGLTALVPVAAAVSDWTDVLIDPDRPDAAGELAQGLLDLPGWAALDAAEVPAGGGAWRLAAAWPGQVVVLPASTCLELPVRPLPELLATLPSRHRRDLARQQRRAEELAVRSEPVPPEPEPIAAAVGELLDLHCRQWAGRPVNPLHLDPRFRAHLTEAAAVMVPAGQAALTRFVLAGEVVGVSLALIADGAVGGYLYGARPGLRSRLDVSALMVRTDLQLGHSRGATRLSLLRGEEAPKLRWQPAARRSHRLLFRPPTAGPGHGLAVAGLLRRAAAERVRRADPRSAVGVVARVVDQLRRGRVVPRRQQLVEIDDAGGAGDR